MSKQESDGLPRHAICLVVDRLSAGFLGAYGNTWIRTPNLDRLAAQSLLLDGAFIDSPLLSDIYHGFWLGAHSAVPSDSLPPSLPAQLAEAGVATVLVSDDPDVANHSIATPFDQIVQLEFPPAESVADSWERTLLAAFFASAFDAIKNLDRSSLIWLHTRALTAAWDAPLNYRDSYAEEDDPTPPDGVTVRGFKLPVDFDPDELLGVMHCYAGQLCVLDECVGILLDELSQNAAFAHTLLAVISARGFPLGEHLNVGIGDADEPLYGELVQVPWMLRLPDGAGAGQRSAAFAHPCDLYRTLLDWWDVPEATARGVETWGGNLLSMIGGGCRHWCRNRAVIAGQSDQWAIRTAAWYLRFDAEGGSELYCKADDRWEVNDVSSRCPDVVEKLTELCRQTRARAWNSPLDEILVTGLD